LNPLIPRLAVRPDLAYRLFYPQVPSILCAKATRVAAMPVVSAVSISENPPIIGVSIRRDLTTNYVMKKSKTFSLNWVDFKKRRLIKRLTNKSLRSKDKLRSLNIEYSVLMNTPILQDALAYAIMKKEKVTKIGDHDWFVGRIIGAMASLDFDMYWKFEEYRPILYLGSKRKSLATI
jgi:flavin reductase (DIM6/NTAB) family NADH-FMN oxidoreductase RutF